MKYTGEQLCVFDALVLPLLALQKKSKDVLTEMQFSFTNSITNRRACFFVFFFFILEGGKNRIIEQNMK